MILNMSVMNLHDKLSASSSTSAVGGLLSLLLKTTFPYLLNKSSNISSVSSTFCKDTNHVRNTASKVLEALTLTSNKQIDNYALIIAIFQFQPSLQ